MLLNRANTETDLSKRDDMNSMVRILEIIDHYEMGEVELITYLERSVRRFIRQKNRMFKTERAILKFFRKDLLETEEKEERTVAFKKLKHTLKKLFEDPFEAKIAEYFDFNAWIESNIEGRSFAEMVKINNGN